MAHYICSPVVDLRAKPEELLPKDYAHHDLRLSQLLYGEKVSILKEEEEWLFIEAPCQNYEGWIHASECQTANYQPNSVVCLPFVKLDHLTLSYGTTIKSNHAGEIELLNGEKMTCDSQAIRPFSSQTDPRTLIIQEAKSFVGFPYLWGGCGFHPDLIASVDCSGLIHLLYRSIGMQIPRDAHDQAEMANPTEKLLPGDLLYLSRDKTGRISHVILKVDETTYMEAPESGKNIRFLHEGKDFGFKGDQIHIFDRTYCHYWYPRSFLGASESK